MLSAACIGEFNRQRLWRNTIFHPVDQCLECRCWLAAISAGTVREAGDFEVAEEAVDVRGRGVDTVVVVIGAFGGDETISLVSLSVSCSV